MKRLIVHISLFILLISACSPSPEIVQTAMAKTDIVQLSSTPDLYIPTLTETFTPSPIPTKTPFLIRTNTPLSPTDFAATLISVYLTATEEQNINVLKNYIKRANEILSYVYVPALGNFKSLVSETINSSVYDDPNWKDRLQTSLEKLGIAADRLSLLDPVPIQAMNLDEKLKMVAKETKALVENYHDWVFLSDFSAKDKAGDNMDNISLLFEQSIPEINRIEQLIK